MTYVRGFPQSQTVENKKGHQGGVLWIAPLDGLGTDLPAGLSGAGYDDANNNYAYRNTADVQNAEWGGAGHQDEIRVYVKSAANARGDEQE